MNLTDFNKNSLK